jgi:hypothetical protein
MSRYIDEQPSISSHISLGDSGYQTLKNQSQRLIMDDFDDTHASFVDWCCCFPDNTHDMGRDLEDILRDGAQNRK